VAKINDSIAQRRRLGYFTGVLAIIAVVLFLRLVYLQVIEHNYYMTEATSEQQHKYVIPAVRGDLYVHDGDGISPIALNETLSVMYADPRYIKDKAGVAQKLAAATGASASTYLASLNAGIDYALLANKMSAGTVNHVKALNIPGIGFTQQTYRTYPEGQLAAQALGFVDANGVGQYGLEGYMNKELAGTPGMLAAKTDTYGIPIATANNIAKAPMDGTSYLLTIDRNIQAEAETEIAAQVQKVKAKSGSVVIINPANGAVIAMATYPAFDPNNYGQVTNYSTFSNPVVSGAFEPGSGMKVFTMAAGLNQGVVTPSTTYDDPHCYKIDGANVCDADGDAPGPNKSMTVVLRDSLNTGVMFVLRMLGGNPNNFTLAGKQLLYSYFTKHFDFGMPTGIEQTDEETGVVQQPTNQAGNDVTYANMAFGQGISVTMIQMVEAMAAIANGGSLWQPHLVDAVMNNDGSETTVAPKLLKTHVMKQSAISELNTMLQVVVQHGSGYLAAQENPGYAISGKTGTAQIASPNGGYITGENIGSFIGYAPSNDPKFVMMVRINDPSVNCDSAECGYAEYTTVPVFGDICKWLFKYYDIPPTQ
jgi:cell division protein FtsI/penicillin-binding protein 2